MLGKHGSLSFISITFLHLGTNCVPPKGSLWVQLWRSLPMDVVVKRPGQHHLRQSNDCPQHQQCQLLGAWRVSERPTQ